MIVTSKAKMTETTKHWLDRGHWSPGSDITAETQHYARWYDARTMALVEQVGKLGSWHLEDNDPNSLWVHEELREIVKEIHRQVEDWLERGFPFESEDKWSR